MVLVTCTAIASQQQTHDAHDAEFATSLQAEEPTHVRDDNLMTFEDTAIYEEVEYSDPDRGDSGNPYLDPKVSTLLERPYKLNAFSWNSSSASGTNLVAVNLLNEWFKKPLNKDVLSKYRFFACDFKVTMRMQSTMMHYGKLAVAWVPCQFPVPNPVPSLASLFALDVNLIDATQGDTLDITVPFMHPLKWWNVPDVDQETANHLGPVLYITVFANCGNAQDTAATIPVITYIQAQNIRVSGPCQNSLSADPTPSMFQDNLENHHAISNPREAIDSVPSFVSIRNMASVGQSREPDTTVRLSLEAGTTMDYSNKMVHAMLENETNVLNICRRPSYIGSYTIFPGFSGHVAKIPVSPVYTSNFGVANDQPYVITNAQVITRLAKFWHGSMKYLISFTCSHVSTIRVAAMVSYDAGNTSTDDYAVAVWDVKGSCYKELEVPFLSSFPYIPFTGQLPNSTNHDSKYGVPFLHFVVLNPLTNGSVSTVAAPCRMQILSAVGDDFRLFLPFGRVNYDLAKMTDSVFQDNLGTMFAKEFPTAGTTGQKVNIPEYNFGEEFIDIRDLLCRYTKDTISDETIRRSMPPFYKGLFRFARYGVRFKIMQPNSYATAAVNIRNAPDWTFGETPPRDIVPHPDEAPLQVELPFYESWYFDLPTTVPLSGLFAPSGDVYRALSSDSVFSFWTVAKYFTNAPPSPPPEGEIVSLNRTLTRQTYAN